MVRLNDVLEAVSYTLGPREPHHKLNTNSATNMCVLLKGTLKYTIGVVNPRCLYPSIVDPVVEFWAYIPQERRRNIFNIGEHSLTLDADSSYYIHVLVKDLGIRNDFKVRYSKSANYIKRDTKAKLLIDPYKEVTHQSPTQLAVELHFPLVTYRESDYESDLSEGRWLDIATKRLTLPVNDTTDGILIDVRSTHLVALDVDDATVVSFTNLVEYISTIDSWTNCYIYKSSETGLHAYLRFSEVRNAMPIFMMPSPLCNGFRTWALNSGFQVIRRGPKFHKPNSDIVQLAQLDRDGSTVVICTNIKHYNDPYISNMTINLRNPE